MLRVETNDLEIMPYPAPWGGGVYSYNGIPFTGIVFENYTNGLLMHEYSHVDGYEEGLQIDYWPTGLKAEEWYSKDGGVYQYNKKWDEQGNLIYHVTFDDFGNKIKIIKHPNPDLEE